MTSQLSKQTDELMALDGAFPVSDVDPFSYMPGEGITLSQAVIRGKRRATQRLDESMRQAIAHEYVEGALIRELAGKYQVHRETVMRVLKATTTPTRHGVAKLKPELLRVIQGMRATGARLQAMGERFGVSRKSVRRFLDRGVGI